MRCLFGADKADQGWLSFAGDNFYEKKVHHEPRHAIASGLGLVVEDRRSQGLMLAASISDNIFWVKNRVSLTPGGSCHTSRQRVVPCTLWSP